MNNKKVIGILMATLLAVALVSAAFNPGEDIDGKSTFNIYDFLTINATAIYQNGNAVIDSTSVSNYSVNSSNYANESNYWNGLNTPADINAGDITDDGTYIDSTSESDLNTNSSNYWDGLNTPADINAGDITDDGTYIDTASEGDLNVNRSGYWDNLDSPADISTGDLTDDGTYIQSSEEGNLNVNSTTWWASVSSFIAKWFYNSGDVLSFNETQMNKSIQEYGDPNYLMVDQTTYQTIDNGIPRLYEDRNITEEHHLVDKMYVDIATSNLGQRFYMLNNASGVEDYKLTQGADTIPAFSNDYAITVDGQYVGGWISPVGTEFTKLPAGIYNWVVYLEKTGTKTLRVYWTLNERLANGTEYLIDTSAQSNLITAKERFDVTKNLDSDYHVTAGSRIVGKIYAVLGTSGVDPTLRIYGGGTDDSHWEIPTNKEILDTIYIEQVNEGSLNVNSSDYWDGLNTPADINAGDITDDGTYALREGSAQVTIDAANITSGTIDDARIPSGITRDNELANTTPITLVGTTYGLITCGDAELLQYNATAGQWECQAVAGTGTVTSITAGDGLTGGTITSAGTVALNTTFTDNLYAALSSLANYLTLDRATTDFYNKTETTGLLGSYLTLARSVTDFYNKTEIATEISTALEPYLTLSRATTDFYNKTEITNFGYIADVVEDTTPQLGGNLSTNSNDIRIDSGDMIGFVDGTNACIFYNGTSIIINNNATGINCP